MIVLFTCVFGIVATAAGMFAADRMQVMVPVTPMSELALPIGHWVTTGLWALGMMRLAPANRRQVIFRCIGVGFALHGLILVALFVPRLDDRAAFSATVYLIYARLFCVMTVALSTAWLLGWWQRMRTDSHLVRLETALLAGWVALLIAIVHHNVLMAVAGVAIGLAIAGTSRMARTRSLDRAAATIGRIAADERAFLVAVFIIALGLRLLYVTRIMSDANYLDAGADGRVYDELGWSLAQGEGIRASFTDRFPLLLLGYVWFAGAVYAVAGHNYFALTALQSILGAAACVLLYGVADRVFGRATARVAAIFTALSFPLVFAAATIGHQAVDVFLTVLLVWLLVPIINVDAGFWRWMSAGIVAGLAFAVRETNLFLVAFLLPWMAVAGPGGWRSSGRRLTAFAAGAAVVILPLVAPRVGTADARRAMLGHFDRLYRGEGEGRSTRTDIVGPLADPNAALAQFRDDPARVVGTLARAYARNMAVQFLSQPYGGFDLVFLRKGSAYYYGMWFYAYALTVIGAIVTVRRIRSGGVVASGAILVLGVIASRTFPHIILESDYRHRVPIEPLLILLASVGVVALCREMAAPATRRGFTGSDLSVAQLP